MLGTQKVDNKFNKFNKFNHGLDGIIFMIEKLKEENISIGTKLASELQKYHPDINIYKLIHVSQHNDHNDHNKKILRYLDMPKQVYMVANTKKEYLSYSDEYGFVYNTTLF